MGVAVDESEIEDCFRIGKFIQGKTRPILVKFARLDIKRNIYKIKKMLKGSGIVIREDLTANRVKIIKLLLEKMNGTDGMVWTIDGNIFAKVGENIRKIHSVEDVEKLNLI